jgi:hypothetical protein
MTVIISRNRVSLGQECNVRMSCMNRVMGFECFVGY